MSAVKMFNYIECKGGHMISMEGRECGMLSVSHDEGRRPTGQVGRSECAAVPSLCQTGGAVQSQGTTATSSLHPGRTSLKATATLPSTFTHTAHLSCSLPQAFSFRLSCSLHLSLRLKNETWSWNTSSQWPQARKGCYYYLPNTAVYSNLLENGSARSPEAY